MNRGGWAASFGALCCLFAPALAAFEPAPELQLEAAKPVSGIARGNLSGLVNCSDQWLAVSDRVDGELYVLTEQEEVWQAQAEPIELPEVRPSVLPLYLMAGAWLRSLNGQALDFEAIACDERGQRYLLSESVLGVLKVPAAEAREAAPEWLALGEAFYQQGVDEGLFQQSNALAEGLAITADGRSVWMAAERLARGIVRLQQSDGSWRCPVAGCVLLSERRYLPPEPFGPGVLDKHVMNLDFSDMVHWRDRLWTLERNEHQLCRRHPVSAQRERCWSFAATLLHPDYLYAQAPFGVAEALHIDAGAVTIGIDNNDRARADGDTRPWVFRFKLPEDWNEGYSHE